MASFMRWALAIIVGFLVLQLGGAFVESMALGALGGGALTLVSFVAAVWLGMIVLDRGD